MGTFIVASLLVIIVGAILFKMIWNKKHNKSGCVGCSMKGNCSRYKNE